MRGYLASVCLGLGGLGALVGLGALALGWFAGRGDTQHGAGLLGVAGLGLIIAGGVWPLSAWA